MRRRMNCYGGGEGSEGKSFWEEGDDFGVDVLRFHTCLTDILGFLEKLEWWFEQDIDDEGEEDEEDEAYLDGTNTESEPFEDPVETETPEPLEPPLTVAPPTSLPESTSSTLVPVLRKTTRMAVRVPPAMSSGLSASMAEVAAMSESAFLKDEDIEKSLDSNSVREDAKDEDHAARDEGLAAGDGGPDIRVESCGSDDESRGLDDECHSIESDRIGLGEEDEAVVEGQQQAVLVMGTTLSAPLGLGTGFRSAPESERPERVSASRQPILTAWIDPEDGMVYIDVPAYPSPTPPIQTPPSPEWTSGSLFISPSPSIVPLPISSPMIPLTVLSPVATPTTAGTEGFFTELRAQVEMKIGLIRDHAIRLEELSPALFKRSLEHEQERVAVTSGALWRPVLALESWVDQTDAQRAAL
nr:hypothetical protein [Tanacetum cinerariifolium]